MELVTNVVQMQQQQLAMQLQVKILKESMNTQKMIGNAILSLIETAVPEGKSPDAGQNLDVFA